MNHILLVDNTLEALVLNLFDGLVKKVKVINYE